MEFQEDMLRMAGADAKTMQKAREKGLMGQEPTQQLERDGITHFQSGAIRSTDANKFAYHLISPAILQTLAEVYKEGSTKYGDFNWEKGMPASDLLNHALHHLQLFLSGDNSEDHLGHMLWNVGAMIHSIRYWPDLNKTFLQALAARNINLEEIKACDADIRR